MDTCATLPRAILVALVLLVPPPTLASTDGDVELQETLQSRFNESVHAPDYIEVIVDDGIVRLTGELADEAAVRRVERAVRGTDGVAGLVGRVSIREGSRTGHR